MKPGRYAQALASCGPHVPGWGGGDGGAIEHGILQSGGASACGREDVLGQTPGKPPRAAGQVWLGSQATRSLPQSLEHTAPLGHPAAKTGHAPHAGVADL